MKFFNTIKSWSVILFISLSAFLNNFIDAEASNITLTVDSGIVYSVAFSPDGKTLAPGSYDKTINFRDVSK